jgi:imidazolonepropionase-like amidohydrolase
MARRIAGLAHERFVRLFPSRVAGATSLQAKCLGREIQFESAMRMDGIRRRKNTSLVVLSVVAMSCMPPAQRDPTRPAAATADLALVGAKVYRTPTAEPIADGAVLVAAGKIVAVGPRGQVAVPTSARVMDCAGKVVTAGFWNSHVHFSEPAWRGAATAPAARLEEHLRDMLLRWGFTTVYDLGSRPDDTLGLRRRIESGELAGPRIFTMGMFFPKNGRPSYARDDVALPLLATAEESSALARRYLALGLDGVKLFTGSFQGVDRPVVHMEPAVAAAAVSVAHAEKKPAFAHPQDRRGVDIALDSGVDVLAHTIPSEGQFTPDELARMKAQHVALVPTLAVWTHFVYGDAATRSLDAAVDEVRSYFAEGGTILFGTDVGYDTEYDTTQELEYMGRAMPWQDVLASLTLNPSHYFGRSDAGKIDVGVVADLVVLDGDPAVDVRNLARVRATIRAGKVSYQVRP